MLRLFLMILIVMITISQGAAAAPGMDHYGKTYVGPFAGQNESSDSVLMDSRTMMVAECEHRVFRHCKEDCTINYEGCTSGHDDKQPCEAARKTCHHNCAKISECERE